MSGISLSTGLVSGLPIAELIDAYIEQASGPKYLLEDRLTELQAQQTAWSTINARLLGLQSTVSRLSKTSFFNQYAAASGNEDILTATAGEDANPGAVNLTVKSLVSSHQLVSTGFADSDSTPVGVGEISVEIGHGQLRQPTSLGDLNDGNGVRRGRIRITDGAGESAVIDLTAAVSVDDVLDAINNNADIAVQARVGDSGLIIEDLSGGAEGITVEEYSGGSTARDLGILGASADGILVGSDVYGVSDGTLLANLNDGNGVDFNRQGDDFKITTSDGNAFNVSLVGQLAENTRLDVLNNGNGVRLGTIRISDRAGRTATVDLSGAQTVGEIKTAIESATTDSGEALELSLSLVAVGGVGSLTITDNSTAIKNSEDEQLYDLKIEDVSGYAARDLGIARTSTGGSFQGNGIHRITTMGDVVRAINYATGNDGYVEAVVTSHGIEVRDNTLGGGSLTVEALSDGAGGLSQAAADLGIEGTFESGTASSRRLMAGLNTVLLSSLNGGSGVELGAVSFTSREGTQTEIDFTGAETVQDIINRINETTETSGIRAQLNTAGHGLSIIDTTGGNTSNLMVSDVSGATAAQLGIAGEVAGATLEGENAQLQYVSGKTKLEDLNAGRGVRTGEFQITTSDNQVFSIEVTESQKSVRDILTLINNAGEARGVEATLNATGDGILIKDTNGGSGTLKITDLEGGHTAEDLRIAGEAAIGEFEIDGSQEIRIEIDADDTLEDVALKLREASPDLSVAVLNDGSSSSGYRLSVTSAVSGSAGRLVFDDGDIGLRMSTLVEARDAVVLVGDANGGSPLVVSSSSNTLSGVLPGVDIDLRSVSDDPVSLSVSRDIDRIATDLESFVTNYNTLMSDIEDLTSYDVETEERGLLLSDSTIATVENRLSRSVVRSFDSGEAGLRRLSDVGIRYSDGQMTFDEEVFREKFTDDPDALETFFTEEDDGVGAYLDNILEQFVGDDGGLLTRKSETLANQVEDINERIELMDERLASRRTQYEAQFAALETAMASLQSQQNSLTTLAALASS